MTSLGMARMGAAVGVVYTMPIVVWLLPQIRGNDVDPGALTRIALQALWIAAALALLVFATSDIGASLPEALLGVATAIAVSLPVCALAWLAGSASAPTIVAGLALLGTSGAALAALGKALRRVPRSDVGDVLRAVLQVGGAAAIWGWHRHWLGWVGM